jgi:SAM-dependent methyltransferase
MFFTNKQELIKRYYPNKEVHPFKLLLAEEVKEARNIVDAGCGSGQSFNFVFTPKSGAIFGIDLLFEEIERNKNIDYASVATLENLPFEGQVFDLVFSHDVIEHLERPRDAIAEFSRVLKPGGKLLILTPNNYHYFSIAGRIIPQYLQQIIANKFFNSKDTVFRTYYRCNSAKKMMKIASDYGLKQMIIQHYEPPPRYLAGVPLLFFPAVSYERVVNSVKLLARFRAQIIALFQKIEVNQ